MECRKSSHSTYDLKYHIIWCTKYRYRVITGEVAERVRELIREVCTVNYVDIITGFLSPDHVHILVSVPPVCQSQN
jgi:putative transposase